MLGLEGLSAAHINTILDKAQSLIGENGKIIKIKDLKKTVIANLFFEPSTRTRNTFEIAAQKLGANVINVDIANSATNKGETLMDMFRTLEAMQVDALVIRHSQNGMPHKIAQMINNVSILNAGDGTNAHPTQALLDLLTIRQYKCGFSGLKVAIVGDIIHSRVAHSDVQGLLTLGVAEIRLIAPPYLQQTSYSHAQVVCVDEMDAGIEGVDVIMMLRLQKERMKAANIPNENEYFQRYGLTGKRLKYAQKDAIVMHPGPINRGVEIESAVADGAQSAILRQVTNGIAIRMAVMAMLLAR